MTSAAPSTGMIAASLVFGGTALAGVAAASVYTVQRRKIMETVRAGAEGRGSAEGGGSEVQIRITGYWPYAAKSAAEKRMEGGSEGAAVWSGKKTIDPNTGKRPRIYTLEMHKSDPVKYPYVSLSGDDAIWPFGQHIVIPALGENLVFRVVDTGGHFRGAGKVFRMRGFEPIDIAVDSSKTVLPKDRTIIAHIVPGDNWEGGKAVPTAKLAQNIHATVAGMLAEMGVRDAYPEEDREALARMLASEFRTGDPTERYAAAWVARNRAGALGVSVKDLLAPEGDYGAQGTGGRDFASTRYPATDKSRQLADAVLDAETAADPTNGAVDYFRPDVHDERHSRGAAYWNAVAEGDEAEMARHAGYADYRMSSDEVRDEYARQGLEVVGSVGGIELLGVVE